MNNEKLKKYLEYGEKDKCLEFLEHEIINIIQKKLHEKNVDYEYTNIFDLIEISEKYLDNQIAKCLYIIDKIDNDKDDKISMLLDLYEKIKK